MVIKNINGKELKTGMENTSNTQVNSNFSFDSLQAIRNRLLDLTGRNRLLNFTHGRTGFIRVIDEVPDQLAANILEGAGFNFIPIDEPLREELIEFGFIEVDDKGQEKQIKANPSSKEWAKLKGFNTNYELESRSSSKESKHNDTNIQTQLYPRELEAQLRGIRSKANTALEETGANILYLAFGFLEWFEDEKSDKKRQAPLYLIPVKIDKASLNKELGTYTYTIEYTGEDIISNLSLREKLKHDFHLELPELKEGILPEDYLGKVETKVLRHKPKWQVKRFSTLSMFDFGKLLMYLDLDPDRWPQGENNIQNHAILQKFFAKQGEENGGSGYTGFGEAYLIDELDEVHNQYPLIDDADSSQHSALVDAIQGKNLVIEGPPGSGKSQTITNLIAAAIAQGKRVLFVAEKMAALQVVKSRLARAGLGDFCLELHSYKTQKKQVYENISQRINNQGKYRYPSSINIDIQMYEEKKEALTRYANLINSIWKNTGRTIHQIFSTATRYREEFSDLSLEDIKPYHVDGQLFDEISSRRTIDELKKYTHVFKEVKAQLGTQAELSDHPWFGVYNKNIQLFDCDDVCKLLSLWNNDIRLLEETIYLLNEKLKIPVIVGFYSLDQALRDRENIPKLKGQEYLGLIKFITEGKYKELSEYVDKYRFAKKTQDLLLDSFELAVLRKDKSLEDLIRSKNSLLENIKVSELSLTNSFQQLQLLKRLNEIFYSVEEHIDSLMEQDGDLSKVLSSSFNGFRDCKQYFEHICSLDILFISRRDKIFENDFLDQYLDKLYDLVPKIKPLHKNLERYFDLENLPSVSEIKEINDVLKRSGTFRWFKSDWRAAKSKLLSFSKGLKPNIKALIPLISDLSLYSELVDQMNKEKNYQNLLQHEFKGIDTPVSELISIRCWYKNVRATYGVGFGKKVAFASSLFSIDSEVFKGFKHLAESKALEELDDFFEMYTLLESVFSHPVFNNKDSRLSEDVGIFSLLDGLERDLQVLQSHCKKDFRISQLNKEVENILSLLNAECFLDSDNVSTELFGEGARLSIRHDSTEELISIETTLKLVASINSLESKLLREYLVSSASTESLDLVSTHLEYISKSYDRYQYSYKQFFNKVDLDESAWFKGANADLPLLSERNSRAINQPRWLSTWVDFIRIRSSLSDKGLENLLRYTETGALNLDNIEQIYLYSVFDILSREIINENKVLAYFSGADQSAIRKQFGEYDNKLKKLQQEKIAYQVAKKGSENTVSGVSSGKVASYSEMGLINHEVLKQTRHTPIRQLINRAGESLVSLKPCFMMGPHSVAQYLAPGKIEFDSGDG